MQIKLWSTLEKPFPTQRRKKAKQRNLQYQPFNPPRWPVTWVSKGQEKQKKLHENIKYVVPESKDMNLVQKWELSREWYVNQRTMGVLPSVQSDVWHTRKNKQQRLPPSWTWGILTPRVPPGAAWKGGTRFGVSRRAGGQNTALGVPWLPGRGRWRRQRGLEGE